MRHKQSDLLIAAERACNNEERLAIWKEKKLQLTIKQEQHSIDTSKRWFPSIRPLRLRHH